ncbi:MAG TPA: 2'-5' RNA ligase family protein [Victivallales bacterium]|nr:2'-5' RNA ligase family protein [Victivallales bacterium]
MLRDKRTLKVLICFIFINFLFIGYAFGQVTENKIKQLDIHLVPSKAVIAQIKSFNNLLKKKGILKKYGITPFLDKHPVHLTLYLTDFNIAKLPEIEKNISDLAKKNSTFNFKTTGIVAGKSGFVLLMVNNTKDLNGKLSKQQQLSNQVISLLEKYRYKNAAMPGWVKYYPQKIISFKKYGSPNAFSQFNPHFSILAVSLKNKELKNSFIKDMNKVIKEFKFKPVEAKITAIGVGEVNKDGQITKEIKTIPLK